MTDGEPRVGEAADDGRGEADEEAVAATDRSSAVRAVSAVVPVGIVSDAEVGDDGREGYEVEVRTADGTELDVELHANFGVVGKGSGWLTGRRSRCPVRGAAT